MSTSLLVMVPVALLFIVSGLCFVGCILNTSGLGNGDNSPETKPPNAYSNEVLKETSLVAYWPLNESAATPGMDPAKADDVVGGHTGNYVHKGNMDVYYPCPDFEISPTIHSAPAIGTISLHDQSIVPGDADQPPADPLVLKTGMTIDGGFVTVPLPSVINAGEFTVEAWVRPEWSDAADPATRAIVDSRGLANGSVTGFVLWVNDSGNWEAVFNGTGGNFMQVPAGEAVADGASHVVLTFDGTAASVFINGKLAGGPMTLPGGSTFNPNTTEPMIIGAGFKFLAERTAAKEDLAFPLIPFNGTIQNVAVYDKVLTDTVIESHFFHGNGKEVPAG